MFRTFPTGKMLEIDTIEANIHRVKHASNIYGNLWCLICDSTSVKSPCNLKVRLNTMFYSTVEI